MRCVLARIRLFVAQELEAAIDARCKAGTEGGPEPVDPMVAGKGALYDLRAEGTGRIDAGAGEVDSWMQRAGLALS